MNTNYYLILEITKASIKESRSIISPEARSKHQSRSKEQASVRSQEQASDREQGASISQGATSKQACRSREYGSMVPPTSGQRPQRLGTRGSTASLGSALSSHKSRKSGHPAGGSLQSPIFMRLQDGCIHEMQGTAYTVRPWTF